MAPLEPLERIYYGLNRLRGVVDANKLTLLLTSTASDWDGENAVPVTGEDLTEYLAEQGARSHYSDRYACAYLPRENGPPSGISMPSLSRSGSSWPGSSAEGTCASRI